MELIEMAKEYRRNLALLELRLQELKTARRLCRYAEVRFRLERRIGVLHAMINESRESIFRMEHYYDKSEVGYAAAG